jgi:hypothetical protein
MVWHEKHLQNPLNIITSVGDSVQTLGRSHSLQDFYESRGGADQSPLGNTYTVVHLRSAQIEQNFQIIEAGFTCYTPLNA